MTRRPTQTDIARAVGVSRGLVSLALSGSEGVGEQTRQKILSTAEELGYVRNFNAAALAGQIRSTLGVVLPNLRNPFFESLVHELQVYGNQLGLLPMFVTTQNDPVLEQHIVQRLEEQQVAGLIFVSPAGSMESLSDYAQRLPVAAIGIDPVGGRIDTVHMDEDVAAGSVADYISERGYQRTLFLAPAQQLDDQWVHRRQNALEQAFSRRRLNFQHRVVDGAISTLLTDYLSGEARVAVVPHNDLLAIDVVSAIRGMGLEPGRQIGVLSYDDTHMAQRPEFALTSVHQDAGDLAREAIDFVQARAQEPALPARECLVVPRIVGRGSV